MRASWVIAESTWQGLPRRDHAAFFNILKGVEDTNCGVHGTAWIFHNKNTHFAIYDLRGKYYYFVYTCFSSHNRIYARKVDYCDRSLAVGAIGGSTVALGRIQRLLDSFVDRTDEKLASAFG